MLNDTETYVPQQEGCHIHDISLVFGQRALFASVCFCIHFLNNKKTSDATGREKWSDSKRESRDETQRGGDGAVIRADGDRL